MAKKFYQLSLSDSRNKILTVVKEKYLEPNELIQIDKDVKDPELENQDIYNDYNKPQKRQKTSEASYKLCQK